VVGMSEVMRAAACAESGGPEVLKVMDLPAPQAGQGQVRVRVRAAGVRPFDTAVRQGRLPAWMGEVPYPRIPGNEFAGVILEEAAEAHREVEGRHGAGEVVLTI